MILMMGVVAAANVLVAQPSEQERKERAQAKMEEYKEQLQLSDEQVEALKTIRQEHKKALHDIRENEDLDKPDKLRAHADELEAREEKVKEVLSEEQYAQWVEIREQHDEIKGRRHGRKGREGRYGDGRD